jgi:Trk K+ transport system NAD-binding subunit
MYIFAIESSCDETAAAVIRAEDDRITLLSNVVSSQIEIHALYGGVVPEIASRAHCEAISNVSREAIETAGISFSDIDAIAVTFAPGLIGSLLVGVSFAKSLAMTLNVPIIPVNHIEAHVAAAYLENDELKPPYLALVVSGGHTSLYEVSDYATFTEIGGDYGIVTLMVGDASRLSNKKLKDLATLEGWNFLVAFVESDGETIMPGGETVIKAGDHVGILASKQDVPKVLEFTGAVSAPMDRVAIFGADNISALTVAAQMEEKQTFWYSLLSLGRSKRRKLIVIDRDGSRCRQLSEKFPQARILNGDITDDGLLQDEDICNCDLMVAASGNYERNLMTAAYLKLRGVRRVIALTSDSAFDEIADKLGVDVTIPMRDIVIDAIISRLRGHNVSAVHSIGARKFEIVSCEISPKSKVAGKHLRDIGRNDGELVLLVKNPGSDKHDIPNGDTVLESGAHAVVIMPSGNADIIRKFAGKLEMSA